ncbi:MAG TPA: biopolymer transporter ExbD [Phycisphaerales bacterium]|nr:biopolymer transporter ExbD [Phycisphaerales bacterium]
MIRGRNKHDEDASFDLTPMIDVVMLLIVFFTLTAQFSGRETAALDLPRTLGDPNIAKDAAVVFVDVDKEGRLSSLGQPIELAEIVKQALPPAGTKAGVDVVVRVDRTAPAKHVNDLAKKLRAAGITRWKLATSGEVAPAGGPT